MPVYKGPGGSGSGHSSLERTEVARTPGQPAELDKQFGIEDVDPVGRSEIIIVGRPGSGKTVIAGTFPPPFRWLAADGETCVKSLRWAFKEGRSSLPDLTRRSFVAYTPTEDIRDGHYAVRANAFNKMTDMLDYWFSPADLPNWEGGTLVIDSASEVNEWTMNLGLNINGMYPSPQRPLSGSHSINEKAKLRIITGLQDYKSAGALFDGWLKDIRVECAKNNRNLVLLCHEHEDVEEDKERGSRRVTAIKPALYGQLRDKLPKSFDDVWYATVSANGKDFKVQMHRDPIRDAKTRWGACMNREEEPDYRYLVAKVKDYHNLSKVEFEKKYA